MSTMTQTQVLPPSGSLKAPQGGKDVVATSLEPGVDFERELVKSALADGNRGHLPAVKPNLIAGIQEKPEVSISNPDVTEEAERDLSDPEQAATEEHVGNDRVTEPGDLIAGSERTESIPERGASDEKPGVRNATSYRVQQDMPDAISSSNGTSPHNVDVSEEIETRPDVALNRERKPVAASPVTSNPAKLVENDGVPLRVAETVREPALAQSVSASIKGEPAGDVPEHSQVLERILKGPARPIEDRSAPVSAAQAVARQSIRSVEQKAPALDKLEQVEATEQPTKSLRLNDVVAARGDQQIGDQARESGRDEKLVQDVGKVKVVSQQMHLPASSGASIVQQVGQAVADDLADVKAPTSASPSQPGGNSNAPTGHVMRTINLELKPAELGLMTIKISLRDSVLQLDVQVEDQASARALGQGRDALTSALQGNGYVVDDIVVRPVEASRSTDQFMSQDRNTPDQSSRGSAGEDQARGDRGNAPSRDQSGRSHKQHSGMSNGIETPLSGADTQRDILL